MSFLANCDLTVEIRIIFILKEKGISATQYLAKPFKYGRVIEDLMLNQFLGDGEDNLRTDIPKSD